MKTLRINLVGWLSCLAELRIHLTQKKKWGGGQGDEGVLFVGNVSDVMATGQQSAVIGWGPAMGELLSPGPRHSAHLLPHPG